jgi:alpha-tubulin suppressor-like RCC1 family protein
MAENNIIRYKFNILNEMTESFSNEIELFYIFKDNENNINVFILKNDGNIYAFGSNINGVLGFGHKNNVKTPTINVELSNKQIIDFKNSHHHVIARSIDGKIYSWGSNYQGRLGNGFEDKNIYEPKLNEYLKTEKIVDICCGEAHSVALTNDGAVFSWGWNHFGQVGSESEKACEPIPLKVLGFNNEKIIMISCGLRHSIALTEYGRLFTWGDNRNGQSGIGSRNKSYKPVVIKFDQNLFIEKISCGAKYSLLISRDENIYVFGDNEFGQLGMGDRENRMFPKKLNFTRKFTEIATHSQNNISTAVSKDNIFYIWGMCGNEQILEPKETKLECAEDIFQTFLGITVRTIKHISYVKQNFISNGKYRKNWSEIQQIGNGSFGTIFKVESMLYQEIFAIKKIPLKDSDSMKELKTSLSILDLNNENLVKYYDVWYENDYDLKMGFREYSDNNTLYIQMEFCDKTLKEVRKEISYCFKFKNTQSLNELGFYITGQIFIEILEGISYMHRKKFMHRDLHPENILLKLGNNNKFVKIADFGLAKFTGSCVFHTKDVGHLKYQAPEVESGRYDTKADIYSLGRILVELFVLDFNE